MNNSARNSSLFAIVTLSVFFAYFRVAPSLADEAQALECGMEKNPKMQYVICRTFGDRLKAKKEFTGEYSYLMMNVAINKTHEFRNDKSISKELLKDTLVAMLDIIKNNDANFFQTSFAYAKRLGPAAEDKFNADLEFLTAIMKGN